jgi:hypothetical protein
VDGTRNSAIAIRHTNLVPKFQPIKSENIIQAPVCSLQNQAWASPVDVVDSLLSVLCISV